MNQCKYVAAVVVVSLACASASAADPSGPGSQPQAGRLPITTSDATDFIPDETSRQIGMARSSFVMLDAGATASRLRDAVRHLRDSAKEADETSKRPLTQSADELEALADRAQHGKIRSVDEIDRPSARAIHRLARHHFSLARFSWNADDPHSAGRRMQVVAGNLEHSAALSGQKLKAATREAIKDTRIISGKLIEGVGYGVDEVGRSFETLGKHIEDVGHGIDAHVASGSQK